VIFEFDQIIDQHISGWRGCDQRVQIWNIRKNDSIQLINLYPEENEKRRSSRITRYL